MKHIKEYKIFESKSFDTMLIDVKDILLELNDIEYETRAGRTSLLRDETIISSSTAKGMNIYIYNRKYRDSIRNKPIKLEEVQDCVNRLFEYLKSRNPRTIELFLKDTNGHNLLAPSYGYNKMLDEDITTIEDIGIWRSFYVYTIQIKCLFNI